MNTKFSIYEVCALTALVFGSETWSTYRRHAIPSKRKIKWMSNTPDIVLEPASTTSIEMKIIQNQMQWAGHLCRMKGERFPKQLFYGELYIGKRL